MTTMKHLLGASSLLFALVFFTQCKDDDSDSPNGSASIEITDGPIDDANVKGAFVTVTAVKVDGKEISGFSKQTIDLMAYQNGNTKKLGTIDLESGTYNEVTLVLDHEKDANGTAPGSYVLTEDNMKHSLQATSGATSELKITGSDFEIEEGSTTDLVIDFDLRKAIRHQATPQSDDEYDFVTDAELKSAVRVVEKDETGTIAGKVSDNLGLAGDKIVVYAYGKGDFNKETEMEGQGTSEVAFQKATASTTVNSQGNYTLAFLEPGDYELHFFAYEDSNNDDEMEVLGELQLNLLGNLGFDLNNVSVDTGTSLTLSVNVIGILP